MPTVKGKADAMIDDDDEEEESKGDQIEGLKTTTNIAKYSMILFGFIGVVSLYVTILIWNLSTEYKLLYTSVLSLSLAFIFLGVYSILSDSVKAAEREKRRRRAL
jgi:hypothetical protein